MSKKGTSGRGLGKGGINIKPLCVDVYVYVFVCAKESWEKDGAGACSARITQLALLARSGCKNVLLEEEGKKK